MDHWFVLVLISVTCSIAPVYTAIATPGVTCPPKGKARYPHPTDCTAYYLCAYGKARLQFCPHGLEWIAKKSKCEEADVAGCTKQCDRIVDNPQGTWDPPSCSWSGRPVGTTCSLKCNQGFQLRGSSSIVCTEYGWNSTNGDDYPKCVDNIYLSQDMKNAIKDAMTECDGMLFMLDESGSIGRHNFAKYKVFVNKIIEEFPLSSTRTAGLITFNQTPIVQIHVTESSTQNFQAKVNSVPYRGGWTRILEALERALQEIQRYAPGKRILVILATDGVTQNDATRAANALKNANQPVLTIGIGKKRLKSIESLASIGQNGIRHFFYAEDYEILKTIAYYMGRRNAGAPLKILKRYEEI